MNPFHLSMSVFYELTRQAEEDAGLAPSPEGAYGVLKAGGFPLQVDPSLPEGTIEIRTPGGKTWRFTQGATEPVNPIEYNDGCNGQR